MVVKAGPTEVFLLEMTSNCSVVYGGGGVCTELEDVPLHDSGDEDRG